MIRLVLFDLDNTLLDFEKMKVESIRAAISAMQKKGLKIEAKKAFDEIFKIYKNKGWEYHFVLDKFLKSNLKKMDYNELAAGINAYREKREKTLKLYPNVKKTLGRLKEKNIKMAIITDAPKLQAYIRLTKLGIDKYFDKVIEGKRQKETGRPLKKALKKLKLKPDEILCVGDSVERDLKPAKRFGMTACLAEYGASKREKRLTKGYLGFKLKGISALPGLINILNRS